MTCSYISDCIKSTQIIVGLVNDAYQGLSCNADINELSLNQAVLPLGQML